MKTYGLLGEKLTHSFSPQIHACFGDYDYQLFAMPPNAVDAFLKHRHFDGMNVTIPYKKTVIPYCAELSPRAARIGSVNTILRRADGSLFGDNTDYYGFETLLRKLHYNPRGKKAVILGSGGSSVMVKAVLEDNGANETIVISRTGTNNYANLSLHSDARLIVNTTPVGMFPNNGHAPLSLANFPVCDGVIDIIYNPAKTKFLLEAQTLNIPYINGLPMLVAQAKRAAELFTGKAIPDALTDQITNQIAKQTKNILLIGMPSSGKSTIGKRLSQQLNRPFFDTDTIVEANTGKTIPEIIQTDGIDVFRALETAALAELAKQSGTVIATGGGIVTIPENQPLIRQNSVCVFLNRNPDKLSTEGRPLSIEFGVKKLYTERLPLYQSWCDFEIDSNQTITQAIHSIREALAI